MNIKAQFQRPYSSKILMATHLDEKETSEAAILVPLVLRNGQYYVLLTKRAQHLRHHPGQISFPGGKVDEQDLGIYEAALRETSEEIGLEPENIEILGRLSAHSTSSGFSVHPVIGLLNKPQNVKINFNEVESVFEVPLQYLLHSKHYLVVETYHKNQWHKVRVIVWEGNVIWGATAKILYHLHLYLT